MFKTKFAVDGSLWREVLRNNMVLISKKLSPVARFETVRTILALVAELQWLVYQFDVKSAFLNGDLQEEVYVAQPEGFVKKSDERKVYKLSKALYRLRQAPRAWYNKIDGYFQKNRYKRSENEPTLYVKKEGKNDFIIIYLYVDDIIYISSSNSLLDKFKFQVMNEFEMSDTGLLHYFLVLKYIKVKTKICQRYPE